MGKAAGEPPEQSGRPSDHIEPPRGSAFEDDDLPEDERLDRLLGDSELLYRLQLSGYSPAEWRRPSEEFGRYGYDVLVGWMFKDRIWHEVFKKTGRHLRRPNEPFDEDTIRTLCGDTVVKGLEAFLENVLKKNRWHPELGASLKTYFVGQCCFQFSNVLRGHYRAQKSNREDVLRDPSDWEALLGSSPGSDSPLLRDERIAETLGVVSSDKAREAFALQWVGYSEREIAELLGEVDEKAIENVLGYRRRKAKDQRGKEEAG